MNYKIHVAVFISGAGTNARNIIQYFRNHERIDISLIISNKADSGALQISRDTGVPFYIMTREEFYDKNKIIEILHAHKVQSVVLAGFLWLVPANLIRLYPNRMINIHPALLPKYGGKGMYGMRVHQAVKAAGDTSTGITIHLVNEEYDKGRVLLQKSVEVESSDTPEAIAQKVHQLEYDFFPKVIEEHLLKEFS